MKILLLDNILGAMGLIVLKVARLLIVKRLDCLTKRWDDNKIGLVYCLIMVKTKKLNYI